MLTSPRSSTTSEVTLLQVVIQRDIVAARAGPVAVAVEAALEAVDLGDDLDVLGRAGALHLVQVDVDVLLEDLIVGVLVEHDGPGVPEVVG